MELDERCYSHIVVYALGCCSVRLGDAEKARLDGSAVVMRLMAYVSLVKALEMPCRPIEVQGL